MEFWGIEVKPGESVKCIPGYQKYLHLSSASLAELKKAKSSDALLSVKIDNKKLVIGILSADNAPQLSFDLVFEKEFELSHTGKTSVHLCGYKAIMDEDRPELSGSEEESEDEMDLPVNGKEEAKALQPNPLAKAVAAKPALRAAKQKAQAGKHEKPVEDEDDDGDDSDEDDSEEDASDEDMMDGGNESDSEEDDDLEDASSEEDGTTPKKVGTGLKRPAESSVSAVKTTAEKKAKLVTPTSQKTGVDVKKGVVHIATPHPNKQVGKTPAANDKSKQQTPKSPGQFSCKSCSKGFNSDSALQSHTKAKHSGK